MRKESHPLRRGRHGWKVVVVVAIMLAAMFCYVMSDNEEYPGDIIGEPSLEGPGPSQKAGEFGDDAAE